MVDEPPGKRARNACIYTEAGKGRVHVATWVPESGEKVKVYVDELPVARDETMVFEGPGRMEYVPVRRKDQRCCFYVSGNSGSGKSTWIANCLKKLIKMSPNKETWLFSSIRDYDPVYMSKGKPMLKKVDYDTVPLDKIIPNDLITYKNGKSQGCIAVFDDYDGNEAGKTLQPLLVQCMREGRKLGQDIFMVSHNARDFLRTRDVIVQASTFVTFPAQNRIAMIKLAQNYWDMDKDQIKEHMMDLPVRSPFYFLAHNRYPKSIVTSDRVILMR